MAAPEKPPEGGGDAPARRPTFREMVLGRVEKEAGLARERVDLIANKLVRVEFEEGKKHLPRVFVADSVIDNLSTAWKDSLVVKVLGKNLGYNFMKQKLKALWKPKGGFEIIDVDHGVYMVKFDLPDDKDTVLNGGPWMIFDRCLAVSLWSPDFITSETLALKTMVWLRFPGLNLAYYDESFLFALASSVGKPIRIDVNTKAMHRGRYARVCVEVDLSQPVATRIWFRNQWIRVEFEGLRMICDHCGCYGHLTRNCPGTQAAEPAVQRRPAAAATSEPPMHEKPNPNAGNANAGQQEKPCDGWTEVKKRKEKIKGKSNLNFKKPPQHNKNGGTNQKEKNKGVQVHNEKLPKSRAAVLGRDNSLASGSILSFSAGETSPVLTPLKRRRSNAGIVFSSPTPVPKNGGAPAASGTPQNVVRSLFQAKSMDMEVAQCELQELQNSAVTTMNTKEHPPDGTVMTGGQ
ncbi:uncharacterized protein LOC130712251 [Lotus japonicus]|uniref:uncharacterized protein LOC130712251 n=1 Tax=Lotus japonicus TaxID=34305 RepID=UPI002587CCEC|nr:uncharacterized protein LOC130712251 [Lotus japonicus]